MVNSLHNSKVQIYECENIRLQMDPLGKVAQERNFDGEVEVVNKTTKQMNNKTTKSTDNK